MSSHSHLQTVVEELQTELGKKDSTLKTLKNQKSTTQQEWKFEMKQFEERMESLREELKKERDKSLKKNSRDISEVFNVNLATFFICSKIKKYHGVRTVPKSNRINIRNRGKINTTCTHVHDRSLSWLRTGTSI